MGPSFFTPKKIVGRENINRHKMDAGFYKIYDLIQDQDEHNRQHNYRPNGIF
jgi:hypothetical protein